MYYHLSHRCSFVQLKNTERNDKFQLSFGIWTLFKFQNYCCNYNLYWQIFLFFCAFSIFLSVKLLFLSVNFRAICKAFRFIPTLVPVAIKLEQRDIAIPASRIQLWNFSGHVDTSAGKRPQRRNNRCRNTRRQPRRSALKCPVVVPVTYPQFTSWGSPGINFIFQIPRVISSSRRRRWIPCFKIQGIQYSSPRWKMLLPLSGLEKSYKKIDYNRH